MTDFKLYALYHDRTRPRIHGPLVGVGKVASVLVNGVKKRVRIKDLVPGKKRCDAFLAWQCGQTRTNKRAT